MRILPKTFEEAMHLISNVLKQGDHRYNSTENEVFLAKSILKEFVLLEERQIPEIDALEEKNSKKMGYVQKDEKYVAKILLVKQGFNEKEIFFERRFLGSQSDVLAEKEEIFIPVECCSCRIDKIIDYLPESKEVWIITREFSNEKMKWFVFKRGPNWNDFIKIRKLQQEKLKKTPIDELMNCPKMKK